MTHAGPAEHRLPGTAGDICWFEWGTASAKPSLLLLHATGFHARVWDPVVAALPAGQHIVAPDLRGHGRSFKPTRIDDWAAIADDITGLAGSLCAGPLVGVGHSMGGVTLTRLAAMLPGQFATLLLIDPVIMSPTVYVNPVRQAPEDHPIARRRDQWASPDAMLAHFADRPPYAGWQRAALAAYCRHGLLPSPDGGYTLACAPLLEASIYCSAAHNDPWPAVAMVDCPVTVVRARVAERDGALDFSTSPTDPGLAGTFAHGTDLHWPDASHFIPMEHPERLAALIQSHLEAAQQG